MAFAATSCEKEENVDNRRNDVSANGYTYVDLGLPSGTLWATCNIGANNPEEYGDYFAWGATSPTDIYSWDVYMCTEEQCGTSADPVYIAGLTDIAGTQYDAAHVNWGGDWQMPTSEQLEELLDSCTWTYGQTNGMNGYTVTGPNGNSIFLPFAGVHSGTCYVDSNQWGYYWGSSLMDPIDANGMTLRENEHIFCGHGRCNGSSIRPVINTNTNPSTTFTVTVAANPTEGGTVVGGGTYTAGETITLTAIPNEGYIFSGWSDNFEDNPRTITVNSDMTLTAFFSSAPNHEYVDLGLASGTKWATCNVGALNPEDFGNYYAWGETNTKNDYTWSTYICTEEQCGTPDDPIFAAGLTDIKGTAFDVASVKWGNEWSMPTSEQMDELNYNCTWTWGQTNGVSGYTVTGPNGNSIFLPCAGYFDGDGVIGIGGGSEYNTSTLYTDIPKNNYGIYFESSLRVWDYEVRYVGHSVRPVHE